MLSTATLSVFDVRFRNFLTSTIAGLQVQQYLSLAPSFISELTRRVASGELSRIKVGEPGSGSSFQVQDKVIIIAPDVLKRTDLGAGYIAMLLGHELGHIVDPNGSTGYDSAYSPLQYAQARAGDEGWAYSFELKMRAEIQGNLSLTSTPREVDAVMSTLRTTVDVALSSLPSLQTAQLSQIAKDIALASSDTVRNGIIENRLGAFALNLVPSTDESSTYAKVDARNYIADKIGLKDANVLDPGAIKLTSYDDGSWSASFNLSRSINGATTSVRVTVSGDAAKVQPSGTVAGDFRIIEEIVDRGGNVIKRNRYQENQKLAYTNEDSSAPQTTVAASPLGFEWSRQTVNTDQSISSPIYDEVGNTIGSSTAATSVLGTTITRVVGATTTVTNYDYASRATAISTTGANGAESLSILGTGGVTVFSRTVGFLPNGNQVIELQYPEGKTEQQNYTRTVDPLTGAVSQVLRDRTEVVASSNGVTTATTFDRNDRILQTTENFTELQTGGVVADVRRTTSADGVIRTVRTVNDGIQSESTTEYSVTSQRAASSVVDFLSGASSAYSQWKSGNKIPAFVTIGGATVRVIGGLNPSTIESMQGVGAAFAGVGSALAIDAQFSRSGNELGKATALANGLNTFNTTVYRSFGTNVTTTSVAFNGLDTILNGAGAAQGVGGLINSQLPGVLPVLGVFNGIKNKDPFATIQGIIGIVNPALLATPLGWVLLAASLIYSFSKEPPKGWGEAKFVYSFDGQELDVNAVGESFGLSKVRDAMKGSFSTDAAGVQHYSAGLKDYLYAMINRTVDTDAQAANLNNAMNAPVVLNPDAKVGIIAQRMPTLNYSEARYGNLVGYRLNEVDPLTGQQLRAGLRWDDNWSAYNATMGNATEQENLMQAMIRAALTRGAIAPMWEVQTANMQEANGDLNAGLTEEERAARQGLSVVLDAKRKPVGGTFRAIAIDLDGNGSIGRVANANTSVAFNWDDSGYFKQTDLNSYISIPDTDCFESSNFCCNERKFKGLFLKNNKSRLSKPHLRAI